LLCKQLFSVDYFIPSPEPTETHSFVAVIDRLNFCSCKSLREIAFEPARHALRIYEFDNCSSLEQVSIPMSVETIGCHDDVGTSGLARCPSLRANGYDRACENGIGFRPGQSIVLLFWRLSEP
jgi:hypothetical protein